MSCTNASARGACCDDGSVTQNWRERSPCQLSGKSWRGSRLSPQSYSYVEIFSGWSPVHHHMTKCDRTALTSGWRLCQGGRLHSCRSVAHAMRVHAVVEISLLCARVASVNRQGLVWSLLPVHLQPMCSAFPPCNRSTNVRTAWKVADWSVGASGAARRHRKW